MSTHTPGPWKLDIYEEQNGDKHYFFKQDDKGEEDIIFNASCPGLRAEDAHLIAAAPAMYEALQMVSTILYDIADSAEDVAEWNEGGQMYELSRVVKTALAQAEGSKP